MNVYKMAYLPDGWHYGSTEHINSEDCMGHEFSYYRVTATLWNDGKRGRCVMGVGGTPAEALKACEQKVKDD